MAIASSFGRLRDLVLAQALLLMNAGTLALGTLSTAVLGFVYWWVAARAFAPEVVGFAAAAISLMNLLAHLGEVGLGPFLLGEIGNRERKGALLTAALLAAVGASAFVALMAIAFASQGSIELGTIVGSSGTDALFVAGCALTGLTLVLDQAFVGLLRSHLQLIRNVVFAAGKLMLLVALAIVLGREASESAIYATWLAGQVLSLGLVVVLLRKAGRRILYRPDVRSLRPVFGEVLGHHALSIAVQAPGLVLPFIVTVLLSAEINAAFYAGWMLLSVAFLVPASLSAVLFSIAARDPDQFAARLRLSLGVSALAGVVTALAFLFLSRFMLWVFNPAYAEIAGSALRFLGFGALFMAVKYHYLAVQRVRRRLGVSTVVLTGGAVLEIAAATIGAQTGGIAGTANFWVLAVLVQALVFLPALYAEMTRSGAGRDAPDPERREVQAMLEHNQVGMAEPI